MSPSAPRSNAMKPKGILICLHESPIPSKRNKLATGYDLGSQRHSCQLSEAHSIPWHFIAPPGRLPDI